MSTNIEDNLSSCNVNPFYTPRARTNTKPKILKNIEPTQDISGALAQIEETMNDLARNQTLMMNKITNLERVKQQSRKPPFKGQPQNGLKPRNEKEVPNTLSPSNFLEEYPWCFTCRDSH